MSILSAFLSVPSLSDFQRCLYTHLYETMTRLLNDLFESVAERHFLYHVPLLTRTTQCLLTHMYLYFLNPLTQRHYRAISDYYLKKQVFAMTKANNGFSCYEYGRQIAHRFRHFAYRLEIIFTALLPDLLSSLHRLDARATPYRDTVARSRLREIIILFQ